MAARSDGQDPTPNVAKPGSAHVTPPVATSLVEAEHLLKVAASVTQDARDVWTEIWGQFKPHLTSAGAALPEMQKGFVPACGWPEFLEKLWLLKHYLDSVDRVCKNKH